MNREDYEETGRILGDCILQGGLADSYFLLGRGKQVYQVLGLYKYSSRRFGLCMEITPVKFGRISHNTLPLDERLGDKELKPKSA